jgi:HSP20 family molecular chaperone IbpA
MCAEALAPSQRHTFIHNGRLIYEWDQTLTEVNIYISVPSGVRAKDLAVNIQSNHLSVGIKGNPPYLDVSLLPC